MVTSGQELPSGMNSGTLLEIISQGHPCRPEGGLTKSFKLLDIFISLNKCIWNQNKNMDGFFDTIQQFY
jgi:hypothetical protein